MHETQKIDSVTPSAARQHRSVPLCSVAVVAIVAWPACLRRIDTTVGILQLDDTNVHFRAIILPHENTQRTTSSAFTLPVGRTKRTMATVVRRDAPH
jgi:hypothetical protein